MFVWSSHPWKHPLTKWLCDLCVAEKTGTTRKDVKAVMANYVELAASELKKNGAFRFGGCFNLKLKKKAARPAREGINPFTREPCIFKAKPAFVTVHAKVTKKFLVMIEGSSDHAEFIPLKQLRIRSSPPGCHQRNASRRE